MSPTSASRCSPTARAAPMAGLASCASTHDCSNATMFESGTASITTINNSLSVMLNLILILDIRRGAVHYGAAEQGTDSHKLSEVRTGDSYQRNLIILQCSVYRLQVVHEGGVRRQC